MPSQALQDFKNRLSDVQQLISAHDALIRLRRAEASLQTGGRELDIENFATKLDVKLQREIRSVTGRRPW